MDEFNLNVVGEPIFKSKLLIPNAGFSVSYITPKPNLWFRFWYKVLLNWKWEDVPNGH